MKTQLAEEEKLKAEVKSSRTSNHPEQGHSANEKYAEGL